MFIYLRPTFSKKFTNVSRFKAITISSRKCSASKTTSTSSYCMNSVKQHDYENFICTLLLKDEARSCAFAVRAFNVEVSRVLDQVSKSDIGLMRMKFWEDALLACFSKDISKIPQHPVALELFKAITRCNLTKRYFTSLIKSRYDLLKHNTFENLEAIEAHSEKSISSVYYLILEGSKVRNVNADHAASHLGKAQGLVQQLRCVHMAKNLNAIPLPQDILVKHQVSHEEILRCRPSSRLSECSFEVASRAHQHLVKARGILKNVPEEGRRALLPAVAVHNYLDKLQKLDYNVFDPHLQVRSWWWIPRVWFTNLKKKY
ncbi:hypothetical protein PPYR_08207 [Photinus pyralis]|uniref:15-cis-phytoene synthase n=2 Tax=Photinus pyralis TaxID=7054 RepID=A0A1Y1K5Y6_PHOPY|nr:NADH dehydrogenase (ubiquinone) complex I, assembly factor 6 [Photinus pyralis]KAB0797213.1 hypothetical protein PPYR_08207 [Photinus pyralis]